jgi:ribosomal protein S18 acetylase RimI-like enzyme
MVEIRECRQEDFNSVLLLLRQLWPDKVPDIVALETVFRRAISSDSQICVCASSRTSLVGLGSLTIKNSLWQNGPLAHVDELVVDAAFRKQGIGTRLLNHLIGLAQARGCRRIELDSAFHRKAAHAFYERHGFENRAFLFSRTLHQTTEMP